MKKSGAIFSDCRNYRYLLWRDWNIELPRAVFILLNPSTADENNNDPTVERCQRRAIEWGYGGLQVLNIFALRSTNPKKLYRVNDPIGPENDRYIMATARCASTGIIICGWGQHGHLHNRGLSIIKKLRSHNLKLMALHCCKDGTPGHPLYVGYKQKPFAIAPTP